MPMTPNQMGRQKLLHDMPLPGHYDCLTVQANVTGYRSGEAGKLVVVSRMPSDQLEVKRSYHDPGPWKDVRAAAMDDFEAHLRCVEFLMGWSNT